MVTSICESATYQLHEITARKRFILDLVLTILLGSTHQAPSFDRLASFLTDPDSGESVRSEDALQHEWMFAASL